MISQTFSLGVVSNSPSRRNNRFETYLTTVQAGTSGSPLFTEKGIVGMIILDSPPEVTVSDIETIRLVVEEEWGYPWDLQLYGGPIQGEVSKWWAGERGISL